VRKITEKTSVTPPKAEIPTCATPPDTLLAPLVISPAWFFNVSRDPLPLLKTLPRSLRLALSTICGSSVLKPCTASLAACTITNATPAMTTTIANTSTIEHTRRLQPRRRSIAVAIGERTATLKTETNKRSRTLLIDTSAAPAATTTATSPIVRIEIRTPSSRRRVSREFPPVPSATAASAWLASIGIVATGASLWAGFTAHSVPQRPATPVPPGAKTLP
jgi:hypothetical protein